MERGWDDGRARERGEEFLGDESLGGRRCRLATVPLKLCGLSVVDTSYIDSRRRARPCRVRLLLLEWQRFIPRSLSIPSPLFLFPSRARTCATHRRAPKQRERRDAPNVSLSLSKFESLLIIVDILSFWCLLFLPY